MPRWLLAIPDAIRQLAALDRELLTRRDVEQLFGVSRARAATLMQTFGAELTGNQRTLPRTQLLRQLRRHRTRAAFRGEAARRERLLTELRTARLRALVSVMLYSFARVSAVVAMRRQDYFRQERQGWLRLHEKGGTRHDVPAHHRAAEALDDYLARAGLDAATAALFQSVDPAGRRLTGRVLSRRLVLAMIKRRAAAADLPPSTCCHTFRATGITAYLSNGGTLEHAQRIAAHASPKTTKLYDRTADTITVDTATPTFHRIIWRIETGITHAARPRRRRRRRLHGEHQDLVHPDTTAAARRGVQRRNTSPRRRRQRQVELPNDPANGDARPGEGTRRLVGVEGRLGTSPRVP